MLLVNVSLKLWSLTMAYTLIFAKATYFFSKNTCEFDIVLTKTVNILTTNELVKLTMLWTTGPRILTMHSFSYGTFFNQKAYLSLGTAFPTRLHMHSGDTDQPVHPRICLLWKQSAWFVCVEVLQPSQPNGVMSSVVSLPNHTLTGQA